MHTRSGERFALLRVDVAQANVRELPLWQASRREPFEAAQTARGRVLVAALLAPEPTHQMRSGHAVVVARRARAGGVCVRVRVDPDDAEARVRLAERRDRPARDRVVAADCEHEVARLGRFQHNLVDESEATAHALGVDHPLRLLALGRGRERVISG